MGWFKRHKNDESKEQHSKIVEGMWLKCNSCRAIIYRKEVDRSSWRKSIPVFA